jgi:hypothetical protein
MSSSSAVITTSRVIFEKVGGKLQPLPKKDLAAILSLSAMFVISPVEILLVSGNQSFFELIVFLHP